MSSFEFVLQFLNFSPLWKLKSLWENLHWAEKRKEESLKKNLKILLHRVIIKISKTPCYPINVDWFLLEWSKKKKNFGKKNSKWPTQKNLIFQLRQFSIFFMEISWIGSWVCRIDWCKGNWCVSTYMVMRLCDRSSKTA